MTATDLEGGATAPDCDDPNVLLGRRIRAVRNSRHVTLRELARRVSVSPSLISQIENGKTQVAAVRLQLIAQALDTTEQNLFRTPPESDFDDTIHVATSRSLQERSAHDGALNQHWRDYGSSHLDPVLTAALAAVLETGYHGSSVRDIASRCGLSVPGMYHYYASKQAMLVALLDITMDDLLRRSRAALVEGNDDPAERFCRLIECLALYHTHRQELAFVGASEMRSLEPASRRRIAALRNEQQYMVDAEVDAAAAAGIFTTTKPREASRAVVTMCTALAQWFQPGGPMTPEQIAEQYVQFALDVMRSR